MSRPLADAPAPLAARLTRSPLPHEAGPAAEARARFADLAPELVELLAGTAGASPYLWGLMQRHEAWLREALARSPEAALEAAITAPGEDETSLRQSLRLAKARVALLVALADLGGAWELDEVTRALTRLADFATDRALGFQIGREIARGKLPGLGPEDLSAPGGAHAGAVALAMGKMGAHELNYSSDIDLILLFDESRHAPEDFAEVRAALIRAVRRMSAMLSELTPEGYVFRTDLRLRPDPSVTPVIMGMDAAESYYESVGRTWERAAFIKARPAAGDLAAGAEFLERLTPFVWRKHLDFAAIRDAHDMRLRIRAHKGTGGPFRLEGHDLKLGRGGIREIEFFAQTRQLIAGGRDPSLRLRGTRPALAALAEGGWVAPEVAHTLSGHYAFLREVEHRLQMIRDQQTHRLPSDPEGFARLAHLMGEGDAEALRKRLTDTLEEVHLLTEDFFAPDTPAPAPAAEPEAELSEADHALIAGWEGYPALRSRRAVEIFGRLRPGLIARLAGADRPHEALMAFDGFLKGLPAGVQLFSLFEANPHLVDLIVDIAAVSPELSRYLGRNSKVLDAVIAGDFFAPWPGRAPLEAELAAQMAAAPDYEARLDVSRRWMHEWHFRIGVHLLRGLIGAEEAGRQYAELAEAVVRALWPVVTEHLAARHGPPPGRGATLLGMGSLGAGRLNAASDLDLIVIYDAAGEEASSGPRPLSSRAWYARLTQALVTALSAPTAEGRLYEVDMRLRPSGRQGPVATSLEGFRSYQMTEAWTWEHLALTRARVLAGPEDLTAETEQVRREVLDMPREAEKVLADTAEMRARIERAKGAGLGPLEAKLGPGRLQDIELAAQAMALLAGSPAHDTAAQIRAGEAAGLVSAEAARTLGEASGFFWRVQAALRLVSPGGQAPEDLGEGGLGLVAREAGVAPEALPEAMEDHARGAAEAIDAFLAGAQAAEGDDVR